MVFILSPNKLISSTHRPITDVSHSVPDIRDILVIIATRLRVQRTGSIFDVGRDFLCSSPRPIHTGSGAHTAFCLMIPGSPFLGVKWLGRVADHSPPSSAEVKNAWSRTSTPIPGHGVVSFTRSL